MEGTKENVQQVLAEAVPSSGQNFDRDLFCGALITSWKIITDEQLKLQIGRSKTESTETI